MKIGLIDVDSHNYPNLALMKLSAWHKSRGDTVEWWWSDMVHYDVVYMSKVFSNEYSADVPEPINADRVIKGGTGYAIDLKNGVEVYNKERDPVLPPEIENICPDYSIYPELAKNTAHGFLTRGCPRGCAFCHVAKKEGRKSCQVAELSEFWRGQRNIQIMDPNILACKDREKLLEQLAASRAYVDFNQGLDIRLTDRDVAVAMYPMPGKNINAFWSMEPLLGPVDMREADGLPQWVILGAETGNRADKVAPRREWVDQITEFCAEEKIPVFYKDNLRAYFQDLPASAFPWEVK